MSQSAQSRLETSLMWALLRLHVDIREDSRRREWGCQWHQNTGRKRPGRLGDSRKSCLSLSHCNHLRSHVASCFSTGGFFVWFHNTAALNTCQEHMSPFLTIKIKHPLVDLRPSVHLFCHLQIDTAWRYWRSKSTEVRAYHTAAKGHCDNPCSICMDALDGRGTARRGRVRSTRVR